MRYQYFVSSKSLVLPVDRCNDIQTYSIVGIKAILTIITTKKKVKIDEMNKKNDQELAGIDDDIWFFLTSK